MLRPIEALCGVYQNLVCLQSWPELLEAWLELSSINYHRNAQVSILLNQWLALTMLQATGHWTYSIGLRSSAYGVFLESSSMIRQQGKGHLTTKVIDCRKCVLLWCHPRDN